MTRNISILLAALTVAACAAAPAGAAKRFTIRGAGYGHGVGMSQYGAMGYASHGWDYRRILGHYYTGTSIGVLDEPRTVRVLLQSTRGTAEFTGATRAAGRRLSRTATYVVRGRAAGQVQLLTRRGREIVTALAPLRVTGPGPLTLKGTSGHARRDGAYRGALEFRGGTLGGVDTINAVDVDDYVQGVVPLESPASWPIEALKAQAVAARTYALTTSKSGAGFEHYPDTRSQVYGGVGVEQPSTNAATQATARQLVTYEGTPVATYFFSTSGGRTEDVEKSGLGTRPLPWLKSVEDRYDDVSPRHRWGPIKLTMRSAAAKLRGYVRGRFKGIQVIERGRSPRIVAADVVGSGGRVRVDGPTLRARLGLYDSWAYFTSIKTGRAPKPLPADPPDPGEPMIARVPDVAGLSGSVFPARKGATVRVQLRIGGRWVTVGEARTDRRGRYHAGVSAKGLYRVRYRGDGGPGVRVGG
jgi:stage II sporulation protein D